MKYTAELLDQFRSMINLVFDNRKKAKGSPLTPMQLLELEYPRFFTTGPQDAREEEDDEDESSNIHLTPDPSENYLNIPSSNHPTSQQWVAAMPVVRLKKQPKATSFNLLPTTEIVKFHRAIQQLQARVFPCDVPVPIVYPGSETEVRDVINSYIVTPAWSILRNFSVIGKIDSSKYKTKPKTQTEMEVKSELYVRSRGEEVPKKRGVRTDMILCLSPLLEEDIVEPNLYTGSRNSIFNAKTYSAIKSHLTYLNEMVFSAGPIKKTTYRKAILPIEAKMIGALDLGLFKSIASRKLVFSDVFNKSMARNQRHTLDMLIQALRYADHYRTDFVVICDWKNCVVLEVPEGWFEYHAAKRAKEEKKKEQADAPPASTLRSAVEPPAPEPEPEFEMEWVFVDGSEAKKLIAFYAWCAMVKLQEDIAKSFV